ncbi:malonate transporter subunit MadL (plasmid) [Cereibacter sphaeroides]|uniref:malonate transporter subunit MadL n=1 Tax=Cereibacter sphaeroides TaxID=1063 RepID=UPI0002A353F5|nr:malonate transporter subunit MadL [Cereibacter sphaeroides]AZB57972.1 malonate transporter subunit MadL [Cereibacter sphaeroides]EKX56751.1 Malonate transporter, MadL subunit [Rhodobacter sp. AKP1]
MLIYGVALMSGCMIAGAVLGRLFGHLVGIDADVGGVGIAMLLLVIVSRYLIDRDQLSKLAQDGISFWSAMYIPIVVAMAASQNVVAAFGAGTLAFIAGLLPVFAGFLLIRPIAALGSKDLGAGNAVESGVK